MVLSQIVAKAAGGHHRPVALLFVLLVAALLIGAAVFAAVRLASRRPAPGVPTFASTSGALDPAIEEARMRYARGDLSREDFTRLVSDLAGPASKA